MNRLLKLGTIISLYCLTGCFGHDETRTFQNPYVDAQVYDSNSAYANILVGCIDSISIFGCSFSMLPVIGMDHPEPTRRDIVSRLVVSHQWMGDRFVELLNLYPDEILNLFKPVAAIVIDDDIKRSHYLEDTAAIYLNPDILWLTVEEQITITARINSTGAYTSSVFSNGTTTSRLIQTSNQLTQLDQSDVTLSYRRQLLKDNQYAWKEYSLSYTGSRPLKDIFYLAATNLLHELAHANDLLPVDKLTKVSLDVPPYQAIAQIRKDNIGSQLYEIWPLRSDRLFELGGHYYSEGSDKTLPHSPDFDVVEAFINDGAVDFYAYSVTKPQEDVATLFEIAMMKYFFDVDLGISFITNQDTLVWGARGFIANDLVRIRAQWVVEKILPNSIDVNSFFASLPEPLIYKGPHWEVQ